LYDTGAGGPNESEFGVDWAVMGTEAGGEAGCDVGAGAVDC
jgi:hypothetical protein